MMPLEKCLKTLVALVLTNALQSKQKQRVSRMQNASETQIAEPLFAHSLNRPLLLTQWTPIVLLNPQRHTTVMEGVIAFTPNDNTVLFSIRVLFTLRLAPQTSVHHLNTTNGTGITLNVPTPHRNSVPFL